MYSEQSLDEKLEELERNEGGIGRNNLFLRLAHREKVRPRFEDIAENYLNLIGKPTSSKYINLKVLSILELIRSRDIGLQAIRTAPLNKVFLRPPWVKKRIQESSWSSNNDKKERVIREFRSDQIQFQRPFMSTPHPNSIELKYFDSTAEYAEKLDLSNILCLHLGFIGSNLIAALDANFNNFVYGPDNKNNKRVQGSSFTDYGFDPIKMDPALIMYGPKIHYDVRSKMVTLANNAHKVFERADRHTSKDFFYEMMRQLDSLLESKELISAITVWADNNKCSLKDICLIILPDEALYLLPLSFLGISHGEPLITHIGGVSIGLSLLALKWSITDFHWTTKVNLTAGPPRCTFFGSNGCPRLDLDSEMKAVTKGFQIENVNCVGPTATRDEFFKNFNGGEICWFSGHGSWDISHQIDVGNEYMLFPLSGPVFKDGNLTNWDLISTSIWNFKSLWLTVMNCCVLGKSILVGPNPLGFMSALHTVGSIATISALWPIWDDAAISFAENMSLEIKINFRENNYPRARSLSKAIEKSIKETNSPWLFGAYALWGIP